MNGQNENKTVLGILQEMKENRDKVIVQYQGCEGLLRMAECITMHQPIIDAGGIYYMIGLIRDMNNRGKAGWPGVQDMACNVLVKLTQDQDIAREIIDEFGGAGSIQQIMGMLDSVSASKLLAHLSHRNPPPGASQQQGQLLGPNNPPNQHTAVDRAVEGWKQHAVAEQHQHAEEMDPEPFSIQGSCTNNCHAEEVPLFTLSHCLQILQDRMAKYNTHRLRDNKSNFHRGNNNSSAHSGPY